MKHKAAALAGVVLVTLGTIELLLRFFHAIVLPMPISNEIATGYL